MTETERIANRIYDRYAGQITPYPHAHVLDRAPGMFRNWRSAMRFCLQVAVFALAG